MSRMLPRFFRTTAARAALLYFTVFALVTAGLFVTLYGLTLRAMDDSTEALMDAQLQGLSEQYAALGVRGLVATIRERGQSLDRSRSVYLLADAAYKPLVGNLSAWPKLSSQRDKWYEFDVTVTNNGKAEQHPIRAALVTLPEGYQLLIGTDVIERAQLSRVMQHSGMVALIALVLIGSVIVIWMNRRVLKQVQAITAAGHDMANGDFSRRLPVSGSGDELDELATGLNELLERIEQLTVALRFVIDGTAHDLRGPLNRLRMRLERALETADAVGEEAIQAAIKDADALLRTLEALLRIAQAQSGAAQAEIAELKLDKLVADIAELYEPLAQERGMTLTLSLLPVTVQGSRQLLAHAVANLLDNAIKYTAQRYPQSGGALHVGLELADDLVWLEVRDNGPGIPESDRERVLQRFVRLNSAQAEPGSGLGLSLVAAVCRFHHAQLRLEDAAPGLRVKLAMRRVPDLALAAELEPLQVH